MSKHRLWLVLFGFILLVMTSCSSTGDLQQDSDPPPSVDHKSVPNHVYAFYNHENLLINDPIQTVREVARVNASSAPFTDVYIMSYGWNFTLPDGIANYQNYLRGINRQGFPDTTQRFPDTFRPLFLLVGWTSVTKPAAETAASVLPIGLDKALSWVTGIADTLVFHIPSAWRQSLNAATNALGHHYPDEYIQRAEKEALNEGGVAIRQPLETRALLHGEKGLDVPVSSLIYQLLDMNQKGELSGEENKAPECIEGVRLHSIGHSYGAKLLSLATIEALRGFEYVHGKESTDEKKCDEVRWTRKKKPARIESLVLYNSAFHPNELDYLRNTWVTHPLKYDRNPGGQGTPDDYLRTIPRKAFVYSNTDFATGWMFGLSQTVYNNAHGQKTSQYRTKWIASMREVEHKKLWAIPHWLAKVGLSVGTTAVNIAWGSGTWALRWATHIPQDFVHHITDEEKSKNVKLYPFRAVHYFLPIDQALWKGWFGVGGYSPTDKRGILRHSSQALGRTGLYRHAVGRHNLFGLGTDPLQSFTGKDAEKATEFYETMAASINPPEPIMACREKFYSIDASSILYSAKPVAGSHGALRQDDTKEWVDTPNGRKELSRLTLTIQFIYNFTKSIRETDKCMEPRVYE